MIETVEFRKGIMFLRLAGTVEGKSDSFVSYLKDLVETMGVKYIAVNLASVSSIDEEGIRFIDEIDQYLRKNGGSLVLCGSSSQVEKKCKIMKNLLFASNELNVFSMIQI